MTEVVIKLPDVGEGTAQAELTAWHVKVGDMVAEDQNLADVTTDKATVEIPSPVSGKVVALHGNPGDMVAVGAPIIVLETEQRVDAKVEKKAEKAAPAAVVPKPNGGAGKVQAAPAVRQRGRALNIDLAQLRGSGPDGRVVHKDLDDHLSKARPAAVPVNAGVGAAQEIKIIGIRRKIGERMLESKRNIPHYSYVEEVDMTNLEVVRAQLNVERGTKLSVLPFVMLAVIKALPEFPQLNAHFDDAAGVLHQFAHVNLGVAAQTEKGLMVPVVFNAQAMDLWTLSSEVERVANAARAGTIDRKELMGSTITVTSLGKLGGLVSTPVINRPEVAIIGVNKVAQRPVAVDGQIALRSMMNLSSSFDHRIVDGHAAASFIQRVKAFLEQPALLFVPDPEG